MKRIPIACAFIVIVLVGCGRSDSNTTKENVEKKAASNATTNVSAPITLLSLEQPFVDQHSSIFSALDDADLSKAKAIIQADPTAVNAIDEEGFTPLGRIADVKHMIVSPNSGLNFAAQEDKSDVSTVPLVAVLLVDKGADVNAKNHLGNSPLMWAIYRGKSALAEFLVSKGADVNARNNKGQTPLIYASYMGKPALATLLLTKGAEVDAKDSIGSTALVYAILYANDAAKSALAELLVAKGADVNAKDNEGFVPLINAITKKQSSLARFLIAHGADVNAVFGGEDYKGITSLHVAAGIGDVETTKALLEAGAKTETKDNDGQTPLFNAALRGKLATVELLLKHGAAVNAQDKIGQTPLKVASQHAFADIIELLRKNGGQE